MILHIVSAERATPWKPAADMPTPWTLEVRAQAHIGASSLVLEVEIITLVEHTIERWQCYFLDCAAFKLEPVGSPGNARLTHFDWSRRLAPQPQALWVIEGSEWLPSCSTREIEPGSLHHFVVFEAAASRAWHVAAKSGAARRVGGQEALVQPDASAQADASGGLRLAREEAPV